MTSRRIRLLALVATLLLTGTALAVAASTGYSLNEYTAAGGGGASSGGHYRVNGTIGQSDAGTLTGGPYTLTGGFWAGAAAANTLYLPLVQR